MTTYVKLTCSNCGCNFKRTLSNAHKNSNGKYKNSYCSIPCYRESSKTSIEVPCGQCGKILSKIPKELRNSKSGKLFCNRSCSAKYNNAHKKHGTRRSKLEIHLENFIIETFPNVKVLFNDKTAINSELDFYFPDLRFAIELNGIFHYEPIYGEDKFEKIRDNDKQKVISCYEQDIELAVINSSYISNLTVKNKLQMETIVKNLLEGAIKRTL